MPFIRTSVSLTDKVLALIDQYGSNRSAVISKISTRYAAIMDDADCKLRTQFSLAELNAMIRAAAGYEMTSVAHIRLLPAYFEATFRDGQPADSVVTGETLGKLDSCSLSELVALAEMIDTGEEIDDIIDGPEK